MKLYIGNSYWASTIKEKISYDPLEEDIEADVLIIGGGMSGMMSAFKASEKFNCVLLEGNRVGLGSTCLNTGLIQYMSDDMLYEITKKHGEEIAQSFYKNSYLALDNIEEISEILSKSGRDTEFNRNSSIIIASEKDDLESLRREKLEEDKIDLKTDFLREEELNEKGLNGYGGLITRRDVEINPYKFVAYMGDFASKERKLKIYENTRVDTCDFLNRKLLTNDGNWVKYKKLIIATGYDFMDVIKAFIPDAKLIKTFAMISAPMKKATVNTQDFMVWETASPYFYFRKSVDGNIVIGGNDKKNITLDEDELEQEKEILRKKFKEVRGIDISEVVWKYAAIFGESESGLPYIGVHPNYSDVFIIHGVGGNGTVYSSIASMYVRDFIEGNLESLRKIEYLFPKKRNRND